MIISSQRIPESTFRHAPPVTSPGRCPRCASRILKDSLTGAVMCSKFCGWSVDTADCGNELGYLGLFGAIFHGAKASGRIHKQLDGYDKQMKAV